MPEDERPDLIDHRIEWDIGSFALSIDFNTDGTVYLHCFDMSKPVDNDSGVEATYDMSDWIKNTKLP
jgi:hypothetical protein